MLKWYWDYRHTTGHTQIVEQNGSEYMALVHTNSRSYIKDEKDGNKVTMKTPPGKIRKCPISSNRSPKETLSISKKFNSKRI